MRTERFGWTKRYLCVCTCILKDSRNSICDTKHRFWGNTDPTWSGIAHSNSSFKNVGIWRRRTLSFGCRRRHYADLNVLVLRAVQIPLSIDPVNFLICLSHKWSKFVLHSSKSSSIVFMSRHNTFSFIAIAFILGHTHLLSTTLFVLSNWRSGLRHLQNDKSNNKHYGRC